jgi:hypothetical protein
MEDMSQVLGWPRRMSLLSALAPALVGAAAARDPLSQDHAEKTVTIDPHPHILVRPTNWSPRFVTCTVASSFCIAQGIPYVSIHPCKHAEVMQRLVARCSPVSSHSELNRSSNCSPLLPPRLLPRAAATSRAAGWRNPGTACPQTSPCSCSSSSSQGLPVLNSLELCFGASDPSHPSPSPFHLQRHSHHRVRFHPLHVNAICPRPLCTPCHASAQILVGIAPPAAAECIKFPPPSRLLRPLRSRALPHERR